jgi:CheY-like chemotaxis protein
MKTISIIVVNENKTFRNTLKHILEEMYEMSQISAVSNIDELVLIPNYFCTDIIVLDLMMPEIVGISFAKKIIDTYTDLQIIAISHYNDSIYYENIKEAGFVDCIYKENIIYEIGYKIDNAIKNKKKIHIKIA